MGRGWGGGREGGEGVGMQGERCLVRSLLLPSAGNDRNVNQSPQF